MAEKLAVVLLPGMDGTGELLIGFAEAGPPEFEPLAISYPSRQVLTHADLAQLVAPRLPVDRRFILVAESYSGPVALRLGADPPPGLAGVIPCNSFVRSHVGAGLRLLPWPLLFRLSAPTWFFRRYLVGTDAGQELVSAVRQALRQVAPSVLAAWVHSVLNLDAEEALSDCSVPVGYVRGDDDRLVPQTSLARIQAVRPDVDVVRVAGPHLLLQARPRETWAAIAELAQVLDARNAR